MNILCESNHVVAKSLCTGEMKDVFKNNVDFFAWDIDALMTL